MVVSVNPVNKSSGISYNGIPKRKQRSIDPKKRTKKGFNLLLKIFEEDPKWNDGAAKKKLLEFFDLMGFNDPNVIETRKKLSSMMFK